MIIVIAGHDEKWKMHVGQLLSQAGKQHTIIFAKNGKDCLEQVKQKNANLLILELLVEGIDSLSIIEELNALGHATEMILAIPEQIIAKIQNLGTLPNTWIIEKNFEEAAFLTTIMAFEKNTKTNKEFHYGAGNYISNVAQYDMEVMITNVLHDIGIPAHIKGYQYLRYALMLAVQDMDILNSITKQLYPEIAKEYRTTSQRVERAIRHAILVAWERGKTEQMQEYFSYTLKQGMGKPTNSEFIAMIADKIRLERKMKSA